MITMVPFIWPALGFLMLLDTLSLIFVGRDFSGNDGCADDRPFPIPS